MTLPAILVFAEANGLTLVEAKDVLAVMTWEDAEMASLEWELEEQEEE